MISTEPIGIPTRPPPPGSAAIGRAAEGRA